MSPYLSRIGPEDELAGRRGEIYSTVCDSPGINFEALRERVGMTGGGGPQYHLHVLEKRGRVESFKVGRYRRYFAVGDDHHRRNRIRAMFASSIYLETSVAVSRRPGAIQREIAEAFPGFSRQAVGYRLQNLEAAGAIARHREGSEVIYYATMDGGYVLDHMDARFGQPAESSFRDEHSEIRPLETKAWAASRGPQRPRRD